MRLRSARAGQFLLRTVLASVAMIGISSPATADRDLTFEERVAAQETIERAYYARQLGASQPFEQAIPRATLEQKVRTYLEQSAALEEFWHTPVTAQMLQAEIDRIARGTRFPERLLEIYQALGNDPVLVQECFARPAVVDRLARSFFAFDARWHADTRAEAEALRGRLTSGALDLRAAEPHRSVVTLKRTPAAQQDDHTAAGLRLLPAQYPRVLELPEAEMARIRSRAPGRVGEIGSIAEEREAFVIRVVLAEDSVATEVVVYVVPKISWDAWWTVTRTRLDAHAVPAVGSGSAILPAPRGGAPAIGASADCVPVDEWDNGSLDDVPSGREQHAAVWTGSHMIVWGGSNGSYMNLNTGGQYDPLTDTWTPTRITGAPSGRRNASAVWTGSRMIVWGGDDGIYTNTGGQYNPLTDTWTPTNSVDAPTGRLGHAAVWADGRMIIWGGYDGTSLKTGGIYDPLADAWSPTDTAAAPAGREWLTAVWTGTRMIVWGGHSTVPASFVNTGGQYDPVANSWTPTSVGGAPTAREWHTAIWTGSRMIVWGGNNAGGLRSGGRYDPLADTWTPTTMVGSPSARYFHTAIWSGNRMIVWGGAWANDPTTGGQYDPVTDSWTPVSPVGAPTGGEAHTAVWTGSRMIIWGGWRRSAHMNTGGQYDPLSDAWTRTSTADAPSGRSHHTVVWTGSRMIVWGGLDGTYANTGGRYDPLIDGWSPTSSAGAPSGRYQHTAVWTGSQMIVWGGFDGAGVMTGGRYDPLTDSWNPTATAGAPAGRYVHTAVWTGSRMIVWGGLGESSLVTTTGGQYDPLADDWTPTATAGAPSRRMEHIAAWTGSRMLVWGGWSGGEVNTGGQYNPFTDAWTPISNVGAPSARQYHTSVWTGSRMIVWGGYDDSIRTNTGGQYDPVTDTWISTTTAGAPSERLFPSAIWTGSRMIVWGGDDGVSGVDTGGQYDPLADTWVPTTTDGAPARSRGQRAVWTGNRMVVWGGMGSGGGVYGASAIAGDADADEDGFSVCEGDCDDADGTRSPNAPEVCDGIDNDCDGGVDGLPTTCGVGPCAASGTCLAGADSCTPGAPSPEACDNVDNDCDAVVDAFATTCGVGGCAAVGVCTVGIDSCTPASPIPEICDGVDDDCDGALPAGEADADGDGVRICASDCDDANAATHPGAPEVNDAQDNQCAGDSGYGVVDEVSGIAGFTDPTDSTKYCWPAQAGATSYQVVGSIQRNFSGSCGDGASAVACATIVNLPPSRSAYYFLVRAVAPSVGSWGQRSSGAERAVPCLP